MNTKMICFMGPSGTGKDTILGLVHGIRRVPRLTTRTLKPNEVEGVHYRIISREDYERLFAAGKLVFRHDHAGNLYGIERERIAQEIARAMPEHVPLIVTNIYEWMELRKLFSGRLVTIYVRPPSIAESEKRLRERGDDHEEQIQRRLATVRDELAFVDTLSSEIRRIIHFVINDRLDVATAAVQSIIDSAST